MESARIMFWRFRDYGVKGPRNYTQPDEGKVAGGEGGLDPYNYPKPSTLIPM